MSHAASFSSFIDHKPVSGSRASVVRDRFTGAELGEASWAGPLEAVRALQAGARATEAAASESLEDRLRRLRDFEAAWRRLEDRLVATEALATALPLETVRRREFAGVSRFLEDTLRSVERVLADGTSSRFGGAGLTVALAPSTGGLSFIGFALVSALAAGAPLVIKLSSKTPSMANLWAELLREAGIPEGRVGVLLASGAEVGSILAAHPSVRALLFAGRPETAALVRAAAVKDVRRLQLHGGVKNSVLLLKEADFASPGIFESLVLGAGRSPWAVSRVFVTEDRVDEFLGAAHAFLSGLKPLRSPEGSSPWTPLLTDERVDATLTAATQAAGEKGRWLVTPERVDGTFVRPGLMRDLTNCSSLQQEEIPGPLILVTSVKYAHEMAKWTNVPDFGFAASVFGPHEKAEKMAEKLHVGKTWLNEWWPVSEPVFGWKKSFFGIADPSWSGPFWSQRRL
jgi:aminomuconate-semialdehyde/2-hydroxymuconate-6-semialdehyde dehydrogenase